MIIRSMFSAALLLTSVLTACGEPNKNQTASAGETVVQSDLTEGTLGLVVGQTIDYNAVKGCLVAQVDGVKLFSGNLKRSDCVDKCAVYETSNPGRSCSHGGSLFRSAPTNICEIVGAGGVVKFSAQSIRKACAQECSKYANPARTCLWGGQSVKQ
ncbi:MAG: hypothetical protein RI953_776 [Pseudomonadota bacterium]|jgi:hypothetical protein